MVKRTMNDAAPSPSAGPAGSEIGEPAAQVLRRFRLVFNAVKTGTNKVRSLRRGVRYVNDPVRRDLFKRPDRLLTFCEEGACAGDCDDQAMLVTALLLNLGFHAGLRIFKPDGAKSFEHIYAVVQLPKLNPKNWVGLDTTVPHATVGWEPEGGRTLTVDLSVME